MWCSRGSLGTKADYFPVRLQEFIPEGFGIKYNAFEASERTGATVKVPFFPVEIICVM